MAAQFQVSNLSSSLFVCSDLVIIVRDTSMYFYNYLHSLTFYHQKVIYNLHEMGNMFYVVVAIQ